MAISLHDLKIIMRHYIAEMTKPQDDKWRDIPEGEPIEKWLPAGGIGMTHPALIFELLVRRLLLVSGNVEKSWPAEWSKLSVSDLAGKIV